VALSRHFVPVADFPTLFPTLSSSGDTLLEGPVRRSLVNGWRGDMALRWTAAGMLQAEAQFRKIIGYKTLGDLVNRIEALHQNEEVTPIYDPANLTPA
jgi:hypothetical protein